MKNQTYSITEAHVKPNLEFGRFWQGFGRGADFNFKANDDLMHHYPLSEL